MAKRKPKEIGQTTAATTPEDDLRALCKVLLGRPDILAETPSLSRILAQDWHSKAIVAALTLFLCSWGEFRQLMASRGKEPTSPPLEALCWLSALVRLETVTGGGLIDAMTAIDETYTRAMLRHLGKHGALPEADRHFALLARLWLGGKPNLQETAAT